ncbi:transposable element Tcb1 transposase [Trichonephila clavipes]|nr:transposable element Tcb1 transposase [Trichonephila clavipes]
MVWGAIGYTSLSPLVRIDDTLNSARYISGVLRPTTLPFIRVLRNPTFKQDNARPHVAGIVRTFLDKENVRLLPWPARSSVFH